ncbi:RNA recognition domain-containing protein [Apiospora rasikravindrae]|uniref:RNA recognition domain-containing protein n=1 Tax=Apiospora rasikravindrae TaxID=990691 RepID=A0ABR1TZT5_9PEZI
MASDNNYGPKHAASAAGSHAPIPATMAGNNMTGSYLSGQSSAVPANENGVQPVSAGSDANMRAIMNSFNGLNVNGAPVPLFDTNAAAAAMPMYFPGGFPAAAGLPVGPGQMSMTEPYYVHGGYAWPAATQWAVPGMKDSELRLYNQAPFDYPTGRLGNYKASQPSVAEQQIAHQQDVPPLDNRRSSYSTTESTPATPFFGSTASRDPTTRVTVFDRSTYTTPSPQQVTSAGMVQHPKVFPAVSTAADRDMDALLTRDPAIPQAVPAVFTPQENMKTLEQSLTNPIPGNRNVYIRGLHPTTDDDTLYKYAARFGRVETSKAIIDTTTGACKGFGFAKFVEQRDSEACIRGFYRLGYEVGFARVNVTQTQLTPSRTFYASEASGSPGNPFYHQYSQLASSSAETNGSIALQSYGSTSAESSGSAAQKLHGSSSDPFLGDPSLGDADLGGFEAKIIKFCGCRCYTHDPKFTNFDPRDQESFNSRLKAEGDEGSTNLYISNLPKSVTENELAAIFMNYTILSSKILRDSLGNSRGVGFARFESRDICDEIIQEFHNQPLGEDRLNMQIRYADTPAQKELKRVTAERRQFRTNEYNVGAYGTPLVGLTPTIYNQPNWKRQTSVGNATP